MHKIIERIPQLREDELRKVRAVIDDKLRLYERSKLSEYERLLLADVLHLLREKNYVGVPNHGSYNVRFMKGVKQKTLRKVARDLAIYESRLEIPPKVFRYWRKLYMLAAYALAQRLAANDYPLTNIQPNLTVLMVALGNPAAALNNSFPGYSEEILVNFLLKGSFHD